MRSLKKAVVASTFGMLTAGYSFSAAAQCRPDDLFCAELRIGPSDPPPVVVQPPPVIVQPPPPVVIQPPPPVVYEQPRVIVQQPPRVVVVQAPPQRTVVVQPARFQQQVRYRLVPTFDIGLHLNLGGVFGDRVGAGGAGAGLRIRPAPHLAFDLGLGIYGGTDYQGFARTEVPLTVDALIFVNPEDRLQAYFIAGVGASFAFIGEDPRRRNADRVYLGGQLGIGLEWRLSRFFALNLDIRGFLRENVTEGVVEFSQVTPNGVQSTNTSAGGLVTFGGTFYFLGGE